jgi:hypothetical protein
MEKISRRHFTRNMLSSVLTFSLVESLCKSDSLGGNLKPLAHRWLVELQEMSRDLKGQKITPLEWQNKMDELFARVDLKDLLRAINFNRLARRVRWRDQHEYVDEISFPRLAGLPKDYIFTAMLVAMRKDKPVVPHGHVNMATMHLILSGEVHLRQYDRLQSEDSHAVIKPTIDKICQAGEFSTISDDKNNVHWFQPTGHTALAFNIGLYGINPNKGFTGRDYLDPEHGEKLEGNLLRVRRLAQDEAYRLYSKA